MNVVYIVIITMVNGYKVQSILESIYVKNVITQA